MAAVDEMVDGRGGVRPHWRGVLGTLAGLDPAELANRVQRLDRAAEEEGPSTWRCDPLPLPIPADEFAQLEAGLRQRAALLDAILADAYGPQAMLASGALPPALVHANPGFLRACRTTLSRASGTTLPRASGTAPALSGRFLQSYAADLVRSPDGQWRVLADWTGGALGIGYARESRRLLARVMPELFRPAQVRQLRPFFEAWQDALASAAQPTDGQTPMVALLTLGVSDPHWPEHLALSRDLSCALVQGRDLTVRSGTLFLKTLRGLQQVDVLLRRVPGWALDPLELPMDANPGAGITGLLDAARHDAVRILNHPGAALVEAPVFATFLPSLCRRLLGEPLRLATVMTLWLADDGARRMAQQNVGRWGVRPAFDPAAPWTPLAGLAPDARRALDHSIAARPWAFAASAVTPPSLAPCFEAAGLTPQPIVLRLFLMHDGTGWRMMQGGLARVLQPGQSVTEAIAPGTVFKDVWVLHQDAPDIQGPEPLRQHRLAIQRSTGDMPSRVADDFFWLGRYVERLEMQARLGRAGLMRCARGALLPRELAEMKILAKCLVEAGLPDGDESRLDEAIRRSLTLPGAVGQDLDQVARLIDALRDRLTIETHDAFVHALRTARRDIHEGSRAGLDGMVDALAGLQRLATTVAGVAAEGMVRGGGWLFLDLGRRIERAYLTAATLAVVLDQAPERIHGALRLVLELGDSAITYRSRYGSVEQPAPVLDLMLADTSNPRALAYQFAQAMRLIEQAGPEEDSRSEAGLSEGDLAEAAVGLLRRVGGLVEHVAQAEDPARAAASLAPLLHAVASDTAALSTGITRRFFALLPAVQAVGLEVA